MQMSLNAEDIAFRYEVRAFIEQNYPDAVRQKQARNEPLLKEDYLSWHRIVAEKGWVAPGWPEKYGGTGWNAIQKFLWAEELARENTAELMAFGLKMVGPVIYTYGSEDLKKRFLPGILSGDTWWAQGYSEPGAGSDLASLRTKAVRDGDHYIVNGHKTWTTYAQFADWGFFLVRTDTESKPQAGISFLLLDMKSPGVTVRPIITLGGMHAVNEVWLEDVRVPVDQRIGEENKGWTYAKFLLSHERSGIGGVAQSKRALAKIKEYARTESDGGGALINDPDFLRTLSNLEIDLQAVEVTELRALSLTTTGEEPGPEASLLKVKGTEVRQRISELALELVAYCGVPDQSDTLKIGADLDILHSHYAGAAAATYFDTRKVSIYGGSNEIQRNIMSKVILGL